MPPPTPNSEEPLNAPFGARCFLTALIAGLTLLTAVSLNAPYGARCFLAGCDIEPVKLIIPTS